MQGVGTNTDREWLVGAEQDYYGVLERRKSHVGPRGGRRCAHSVKWLQMQGR